MLERDVTRNFEVLLDTLMKATEAGKSAMLEAASNGDVEQTAQCALDARRTERLQKSIMRHYAAWCKSEGSVDLFSESNEPRVYGWP